MASSKQFVDYLCDQMAQAKVSARRMFGEYGLYCGGSILPVFVTILSL